jgi:hypothetical protein
MLEDAGSIPASSTLYDPQIPVAATHDARPGHRDLSYPATSVVEGVLGDHLP